jgi:sec-independent protein translocase protein TatA
MLEGLFQPMHLLLLLGIALLFFGPKRLPELGKGLGTSIRDFKDAMSQKPEDKSNSQLEAPRAAAMSQTAAPVAAPVAAAAPAAPAPTAQASPGAPTAPPQGPS